MGKDTGKSAAIYLRMSKDVTDDEAGIDRQRALCREVAERRNWKVVGEFVDNDISAYSGKVRPAFLKMLTAIENGDVDVVCAYALDRLARSPRDQLDLMEALRDVKGTIETVKDGVKNPNSSSGQFEMQILNNVATFESARKGERQRDANDALAKTGAPRKAGPVCYGYERAADGNLVIVPDEARVIRDVVTRVLDGESINSVVDWLNRIGVPSPSQNSKKWKKQKGARWRWITVKRLLETGTIAALREHRGEVVGEGTWEPIIPPDRWRELQARLEMTSAEWNRYRAPDPDGYLLTGLLTCGGCGGPMTHTFTHDEPGYGCARGRRSDPDFPHADGFSYVGEREVEEWVLREASVRELSPDAKATDDDARRAELEETRRQYGRERLDGLIDTDTWFDLMRPVNEELARLRPPRSAKKSAPNSPRAKLEALVERIEVVSNKAITGSRGKRVPIDQRATITWREGVTQTAPVPPAPVREAKANPNCSVTSDVIGDCVRTARTLTLDGVRRPLCEGHYRRLREEGDVHADKPFQIHRKREPNETCDVGSQPGDAPCDRVVYSRNGEPPYENLCNAHRQRVYRTGRLDPERPLVRGQGPRERGRFAKVER